MSLGCSIPRFSASKTVRWIILYLAVRESYAVEAVAVHACSASLAIQTDACHPLDSHAITNLYRCIVCARAQFYNLADALVTADLTCLCGEGQD